MRQVGFRCESSEHPHNYRIDETDWCLLHLAQSSSRPEAIGLSFARGSFAFEAGVADVAWESCGEVEFVVDEVFHVDASDAGVLKEDWQWRFKLDPFKFSKFSCKA